MAYSSYENLDVWKRSVRLAIEVCRAAGRSRDFGLRDQLRRSAVSAPSNIAEGSERDSTQDYIRFLRIAKGSCAEMRTQMIIARELGILEVVESERHCAGAREISAMIQGLIFALGRRTPTVSRI